MYIARLQVEEGFLDGLDAKFEPGLNVVIGPRGTGKTSLVELLRFGLSVESHTSEAGRVSLEHALSILGDGRVTVTLQDGGSAQLVVSRAASEVKARASSTYPRPIVFSQTEIESVGLHARARLRLLDGFLHGRDRADAEEAVALGEIRSLTLEMDALRREVAGLDERLADLPTIREELAVVAAEEARLSQMSAATRAKQQELDRVAEQIAAIAVTSATLDRMDLDAGRWHAALQDAKRLVPVEPSSEGETSPYVSIMSRISKAAHLVDRAVVELSSGREQIRQIQRDIISTKLRLEDRSRELRREVESLQSGAGAVAQRGQVLREGRARLESLAKLHERRSADLRSLALQRRDALSRLERARSLRFEDRASVARGLNTRLGPRIRIAIEQGGDFESYAAILADVLRGSGLRYSDLSRLLAQSVNPRELIELVEAGDFEQLAEITGISRDRAARVVAYMDDVGLGEIVTVPVEDSVSLQLLDGSDYKQTNELSTGQRCTVVLPLLLEHSDRVLVVDQPEDHIDNAFIVDTLIKAILARSKKAQSIFTTHNANIPVLGGAQRVIQMDSDGKCGFVERAGPLDDSQIVDAITRVMEGGKEAFRRRASFYERYHSR